MRGGGSPSGGSPSQGVLHLGGSPLGGSPSRGWGVLHPGGGGFSIPGGSPSGGFSIWGGSPSQGGVPCDLSHHAFDVTCMLPPHQLRHINSAPAYILLPGHVTCKACWETHTPRVNRMTDRCKIITLPQTSFAGSNNGQQAHINPTMNV